MTGKPMFGRQYAPRSELTHPPHRGPFYPNIPTARDIFYEVRDSDTPIPMRVFYDRCPTDTMWEVVVDKIRTMIRQGWVKYDDPRARVLERSVFLHPNFRRD